MLTPRTKFLFYSIAFLLVELFLWIFYPSNRTESDDGYWYASGVRDQDFLSLFYPRTFLFLPVVKFSYILLSKTGIYLDAYLFMCIISMLFSGLTLILTYNILYKHFQFNRSSALFTVILVLFSYEFWRYSVEAEVYILSIFLVLSVLKLFFLYEKILSIKYLIVLSLTASFATLIYKPNFIPVFLIFPLFFFNKGMYRQLALYYVIGAFLIIGSIYLVYQQLNVSEPFIDYFFGGTSTPVGSAATSIVVIASNIISIIWMYSYNGLQEVIRSFFPHKIMNEEVLIASQIGNGRYFLTVVLIVLLIILVLMIINTFSKKPPIFKNRNSRILLFWILLYGFFLLVMDPTSHEPWLMLQVPFIILFTIIFINPLTCKRVWLAPAFLILILINNSIGGILLLKKNKYDFYLQKSGWLIDNSTSKDIIMSYGPTSYIRYLKYHTPAKIVNVEEDYETATNLLLHPDETGNIYFTEYVLKPPDAILHRSKNEMSKFIEMFRKYNINAVEVWNNEEYKFSTYKISKLRN